MPLNPDFAFHPVPPIPHPVNPGIQDTDPLGPLADLPGNWSGTGFNAIWRPFNGPGSDRFLELNLTSETLDFERIPGKIPNRGLFQGDIEMTGIRYLQQIFDRNAMGPDGKPAGLHLEPGLWLLVPPTTSPLEASTVVRMGSIPHGTTVLAQGLVLPAVPSAPGITPVSIAPFAIGSPNAPMHLPEQTLTSQSVFRSTDAELAGITQPMVDNPNSVLEAALHGQNVVSTTALIVSSDQNTPVLGGGVQNTAFLQGADAANANAETVVVTATFWIERLADQSLQLQYSQTVLLNFNGISWPHVSVGTLKKLSPAIAA